MKRHQGHPAKAPRPDTGPANGKLSPDAQVIGVPAPELKLYPTEAATGTAVGPNGQDFVVLMLQSGEFGAKAFITVDAADAIAENLKAAAVKARAKRSGIAIEGSPAEAMRNAKDIAAGQRAVRGEG